MRMVTHPHPASLPTWNILYIYHEDGAPEKRLDTKVNFYDCPLSNFLLQQALLSSQACAAGAMFVCVCWSVCVWGGNRGAFEGSLWLGGGLEDRCNCMLYCGDAVRGPSERTQCPLPGKAHGVLGAESLLQGGVPPPGRKACLVACSLPEQTPTATVHTPAQLSVFCFFATSTCPFQLTPRLRSPGLLLVLPWEPEFLLCLPAETW